MRVPVRKQRELSGFTLVEMAIVLVIIGIILAGVMKGRDIVRSAQMKEFAQSFGNKWVTLTQTYYDKTGQQLDDGTNNGGKNALSDGYMDGFGSSTDDEDDMLARLQGVGVDPCNNIKTVAETTSFTITGTTAKACTGSKNPFVYVGDSEYLGQVPIFVNWGAFYDVTAARIKNCVSFSNCPLEFAKALDTLVDGEANGAAGFALNGGYQAAYAAGTPVASVFKTGTSSTVGTPATVSFTPAAWPIYAAAAQVTEIFIVLDY